MTRWIAPTFAGRDPSGTSEHHRQRSWTFAPGQVVSLVVGVGFVIVGVLALVRAELDGSLATPVVEVLGYTHTAWLGPGRDRSRAAR